MLQMRYGSSRGLGSNQKYTQAPLFRPFGMSKWVISSISLVVRSSTGFSRHRVPHRIVHRTLYLIPSNSIKIRYLCIVRYAVETNPSRMTNGSRLRTNPGKRGFRSSQNQPRGVPANHPGPFPANQTARRRPETNQEQPRSPLVRLRDSESLHNKKQSFANCE